MTTDTLQEYKLIDWSKPPPVVEEKLMKLTKYEAHHLNKAFALNRITKRWVPVD